MIVLPDQVCPALWEASAGCGQVTEWTQVQVVRVTGVELGLGQCGGVVRGLTVR